MMNQPRYGYRGAPTGANPYANPYAYPQYPTQPLTPRQLVERLDLDRRQRLLRPITLGTFLLSVLLLVDVLYPAVDQGGLVAVTVALIASGLAYLLCRIRMTNASAYVLLGGISVAVAIVITGHALQQNGLNTVDLRYYDFFVLPILLSAALSDRRAPIVIAIGACAFTIGSLLLLPHQTALQIYWDGNDKVAAGSLYDVIAVPVVILILTALAARLGVDSVRRALLGAARADELALLNERIVSQAREIEFERRRLADGVSHIQQVNAAFARGSYDARVRVDEGELLPLAMSLNALFERLQRLSRDQESYARLVMGANQLAVALRRVRAGDPYVTPEYTGTPLDQALVELATMRQLLRAPGAEPLSGNRPSQQGGYAAYNNTAAVYGQAPIPSADRFSAPSGFDHSANVTVDQGVDPGDNLAGDPNRQDAPADGVEQGSESGELPFWLRPSDE
jgi:hypothetical protein